MSYNVRCANDILRYEVNGSVQTRINYVIKNILYYMPDSIGFQEVTISSDPKIATWYSLIKEKIKNNYIGVGLGRDKGKKTEANPIFYNKNKLELLVKEQNGFPQNQINPLLNSNLLEMDVSVY